MNNKIKKMKKLFYGYTITYELPEVPFKYNDISIKMISVRIITHPYKRLINYDVSGA